MKCTTAVQRINSGIRSPVQQPPAARGARDDVMAPAPAPACPSAKLHAGSIVGPLRIDGALLAHRFAACAFTAASRHFWQMPGLSASTLYVGPFLPPTRQQPSICTLIST